MKLFIHHRPLPYAVVKRLRLGDGKLSSYCTLLAAFSRRKDAEEWRREFEDWKDLRVVRVDAHLKKLAAARSEVASKEGAKP